MFDVLIESTPEHRDARTWIYFAASSAFWSVVLVAVAIVGIFTYDARLDSDFDRISLTAVPVGSPPPPAPRAQVEEHSQAQAPQGFVSVTHPPAAVTPPQPHPPVASSGATEGLPFGDPNGRDGGEPGSNGDGPVGFPSTGPGSGHAAVPPPQPPPDPPVAERRPEPPSKPVSKGVLNGIAVRRVTPPYPDLARQAGVSGEVVVEVVVSEAGDVVSARAVSGHPMLRAAAERAATNWKFTPTLLSGHPTKVVGTITFSFKRP